MEQRRTRREAACVSLLHWLGRDSSAADVDGVDSLAELPLKSTIQAQVCRAHRVRSVVFLRLQSLWFWKDWHAKTLLLDYRDAFRNLFPVLSIFCMCYAKPHW